MRPQIGCTRAYNDLMGQRATLVFVALTACIEPSLQPCGDLSCPPDEMCIDDAVCATSQQIAACAALADGAGCQSTIATGYCSHGACIANVCGDGKVTGNEVCDGTDVRATCVDLGYYEGMPTCTPSCTLERSNCSGRCGDGIVQADFGESCDHNQPAITCAGLGLDYGALGCNAFCTPDIIGSCGAFGWETLLAPSSSATSGGAASAHGAIAVDGAHVRVMWDGTLTQIDNPGWTYATADSTRFVAVGANTSGWFDGTWHMVAAGLAADHGIALSGDQVYGLSGDCSFAALDLTASTTTMLPTPTGPGCHLPIAAGSSVYTYDNNGLARWNAGGWTYPIEDPNLTSIGPGATGTLLVTRNFTDIDTFDLATQSVTSTSPTADFNDGELADADGDVLLYVNEYNDNAVSFYTGAGSIALTTSSEILFDIASLGEGSFTQSADGAIIAISGGIYRLRPLGQIPLLDSSNLNYVVSIAPLADGAIAVCGQQLSWFGPDPLQGVGSTSFSNCNALVGDPRAEHLVIGINGTVYRSSDGITYHGELPGASALVGTPSNAWALVGGGLSHGVSGTWTTVDPPPTCQLATIAGGGSLPVVALAACGGDVANAIYRYDTTAWTLITTATVQLGVIAEAPDGAIYVSGDQTYLVGASGLSVVAPASAVIVPLSADDVFVEPAPNVLEHVSQGVVSTVLTPQGPLAVTPSTLYVWARSSPLSYIGTGDIHVVSRMVNASQTSRL